MADFTPTPEQQTALDLFETGQDLAIEAGAGTGKTSTLILLAEAAEHDPINGTRRGQYIAFNKAIVVDASAKMPGNVNCSTAHSLAFRHATPGMKARLRASKRMKSMEIARLLRIDPLTVIYGSERKPMSVGYLAGLAMRTITNFCQSADMEPEGRHVPYVDGIDVPTIEGDRTYRNQDEVRRHLMPAVRRAWADLMSPTGSLPFKHEHYLKAWHLSGPRIEADFIMFDEAQDANPVLRAIVDSQQCQKVYVGDSQQAIYGFTGAVNALAAIQEQGGNVTFLSQSFRFGDAVANVANGLLTRLRSPLRLRGFGPVASVVGEVADPDVILTRTNARAVRHLLEAIKAGHKAALVGGGAEVASFARACVDLKEREWTSHPELACFRSWGEVQDYVEQDPQGSELKLMVDLMDEFTPEVIIENLDRTTVEEGADVVISTAHKSKGREWGSVKLSDDFFLPREGEEEVNDDELRLMYVAVTRAKRELDVTAAPQVFGRTRRTVEDEAADAKALTLQYGTRR